MKKSKEEVPTMQKDTPKPVGESLNEKKLKEYDPKKALQYDLHAMHALISMCINDEEIFNLIHARLDMYKQEALTKMQMQKEKPKTE